MQPIIQPPDSRDRLEPERDWETSFERPRRNALFALIGFVVAVGALIIALWALGGDADETVGDPAQTVPPTLAPAPTLAP